MAKYAEHEAFLPYRVVAEYADGSRIAFGGLTMEQAQEAMENAQDEHGDIGYWSTVTDEYYSDGVFYKLIPEPPVLKTSGIETPDGCSIIFSAPNASDEEWETITQKVDRFLTSGPAPSAESIREFLLGLGLEVS